MKHKLLLLTLAAMLFGYCGAYAEPINGDGDTLWTKYVGDVNKIMFHPSGNSVLVASTNEFYELDAQTGNRIRKFENPFDTLAIMNSWGLDINQQGTLMTTIIADGSLLLWDYASGKMINAFSDRIMEAHFGGENDEYIFLNITDNDLNFGVYDISSNILNYNILLPEADYINTIATSPDGKYFAVAGLFTNFGETTSTLALYDATTIEKIGNIVEGISDQYEGTIEKIKFSENSKWLVINTHVASGMIIDLEEFIKSKVTKRDKFVFPMSLKFLYDEKNIIFSTDYPEERAYIVNYFSKDTSYVVNYYLGRFETNKSNHLMACTHYGYVYMFNSNLYYSDVHESTDTDLITNITYQNGTLKYSSSLENVQNIKITDLSGKLVFQSTTTTQNNEINIALTKGIYFLTLSNGKSEYSKKFMVME